MNRIVPGLGLVLALLLGLCHADPGDARLAPGDKVEVAWAGERVEAEFVEYLSNGWIRVKFKSNSIELTPALPPQDVRVLGGAGRTAKRPVRTWTDATGKFKQKARFVALDGDKLTLETEDGKKLTMNLEKLSEADQAMARKIAAKAGPKAGGDGDENPFAAPPGADASPGSTADMGPAGSGGDAGHAPQGDWSQCRMVTPGNPGGWSVPIDAGEAPAKLVSKPIALPATADGQLGGFFAVADGLLMARAAGRACVVIRDAPPGKPSQSRLEVLDLARGKVVESVPWSSPHKPVDIDRTGKFILARTDFQFTPGQSAPELGVWKSGDGALEPVRVWNAQDPGNSHTVAPTWAAFVDADHVACVTFPGKLTVWKVSEGRAIWSMELSTSGSPAISPGGKYLAAAVADGVVVLDALTGDTLGRLPGSGDPGRALSFRPDGAQLAALAPQRLVVWDLGSGEIYRDIAFSTKIPATSIDWLFGGHLLAGGGTLIDLERRLELWRYSSGSVRDAAACGELGGWFWHVHRENASNRHSLHAAVIPHEDALRAAAGIDPEQALVIRPGSTFSLDIRVQGQPAEQQQVQQALADRLAAAGMTVASGAPLVLQATTETGQTREISYRSFGRLDRTPEKASVTEQISRVRILENGRTLWESVVTSGAPMALQIKEGQTVQEALAEYQKPSLGFFREVSLPVYLARPAEHGAYGFSTLTPQGVVNTQPPVPRPGN